MKLSILVITLLTAFSNLQAQYSESDKTTPKTSEIGVSYTSDGIGLDYRMHLAGNKYLRISNARIGVGGRLDQNIYRISAGANLGIENRRSIGKKWWINHGTEIGFKYSGMLGQSQTSSAQVSLGYFLGINYDITENLSVGAEIKPYIYGQYNSINRIGTGQRGFAYAGITSIGKINLSYRF